MGNPAWSRRPSPTPGENTADVDFTWWNSPRDPKSVGFSFTTVKKYLGMSDIQDPQIVTCRCRWI